MSTFAPAHQNASEFALSVVIPAYNEEDGIAEIAHRVLAVREELVKVGVTRLELIVVDDASRDRTAEIASSIDGVTLISHTQNRGYGGALKTGFNQATGDLIGFLDADGTYPPEFFPQLCQVALNEAELVIGSRMAGAKSQMPITRRIGNVFFASLLSLLGRQRVTDSASGMRVFRRDVLERVYPLPDGLNLTPVMSTRAIHERIKMSEVPIPYSERMGRSKLSVVRDGTIFLRSMIWTALTYNPVRILGLVGLACLAFTLAIALKFAYCRFILNITEISTIGIADLFAALITGVAGVSFFSLGISFNYLVALFYKRPIRQGLFGRPLFKQPLDRQFGWMGALGLIAGLILGGVTLALGFGQEPGNLENTNRLWLYLLASAMLILVGIQLIIYWIILRVLDELSQREILTQRDMGTPSLENDKDDPLLAKKDVGIA